MKVIRHKTAPPIPIIKIVDMLSGNEPCPSDFSIIEKDGNIIMEPSDLSVSYRENPDDYIVVFTSSRARR